MRPAKTAPWKAGASPLAKSCDSTARLSNLRRPNRSLKTPWKSRLKQSGTGKNFFRRGNSGSVKTPEPKPESKLFIKPKPVSAAAPKPKPSRATPAGQTRLWMSLGETQGVTPIDVVNAVAGETGLPGKVVGTVDVREKHLFVDVATRTRQRHHRQTEPREHQGPQGQGEGGVNWAGAHKLFPSPRRAGRGPG